MAAQNNAQNTRTMSPKKRAFMFAAGVFYKILMKKAAGAWRRLQNEGDLKFAPIYVHPFEKVTVRVDDVDYHFPIHILLYGFQPRHENGIFAQWNERLPYEGTIPFRQAQMDCDGYLVDESELPTENAKPKIILKLYKKLPEKPAVLLWHRYNIIPDVAKKISQMKMHDLVQQRDQLLAENHQLKCQLDTALLVDTYIESVCVHEETSDEGADATMP